MEIVIRRANTPTEAVEITLTPSEAIGLKNYLTSGLSHNRTYASDFSVVMKLAVKMCEQCEDYEAIDELDWRAKSMLDIINERR